MDVRQRWTSGDNVGGQLIFKLRKLVAQAQFPLLQPLQLQLVALPGVAQSLDGGVEIPMFLSKALDMGLESATLFAGKLLVNHSTDRNLGPPRHRKSGDGARRNYGCATLTAQELQQEPQNA